MSNQTVIYKIDYQVPHDKAVKGINAIEAKVLEFEKVLNRVAGKLKTIGQNTPGLTLAMGNFKRLETILRSDVAEASKAETALKRVGTDNRAITTMTQRLEKLSNELKDVQVQAAAAQTSLSGVGSGGPAGTNRRAGSSRTTGGRGGFGGFGAAAIGGGSAFMAYAAYRAGHMAIQATGDATEERRDFFSNAANIASSYRNDLQEVAVLEGKSSVGDEDVKKNLAFQKETLTNADESRELRLEFGGAIGFGKARGNISDETAAGLEKESAKFGIRYGLDMRSTGRMAGLLSNYQKVPTAGDGAATMESMANQLNIYGVGSVKSMMPSIIGLQADMLDEEGGRFDDPAKLAARFGNTTAQAKTPASAATQIRQANRLLRKMAADPDNPAGIRPEDDYETSIRKLAPHISGANADMFLTDLGYHNSTERDSVIKQAKMNSVVDKQVADPAMKATPQQAAARNAEFAGSIQGQQRSADNEEFASMVETGLNGERLKAARVAARARMVKNDTLKRRPTDLVTGFADAVRSASTAGGISGEDIRVDTEAIEQLKREGQALGIDIEARHPGLSTFGRTTSMQDEAQLQKDFGKAAGEVDAAKKLKQAAGLLNGAANDMQRRQGGGGGGPAAGNGGAGVNPGRR